MAFSALAIADATCCLHLEFEPHMSFLAFKHPSSILPVGVRPELTTLVVASAAFSRAFQWPATPRAASPAAADSLRLRWHKSHNARRSRARLGRPVAPRTRRPPTWRSPPSGRGRRAGSHRHGNDAQPPRQSPPTIPSAAANRGLPLAGGRSAADNPLLGPLKERRPADRRRETGTQLVFS